MESALEHALSMLRIPNVIVTDLFGRLRILPAGQSVFWLNASNACL
ncbi:MAG: hypothetical protein QOG58_6478 [Caballeronia sp.]|jgi:hypothetical protein|nr:hypothetical protein [Caballeronia sp.]